MGGHDMTLEQLRAQSERGFRSLRFEPALEAAFIQSRIQALRERARPVAVSALALFLVYCVLDYACFPERVWGWTIPIRLFVVCPVIVLVLALYPMEKRPRLFAALYAFSYLWCSLSLVLIIAVARWQSVAMPYDGILLSLMFGYFVMGLSWRVVSVISSLIVVAYLGMEWAAGTAHAQILHNSFFLLTAHGMGMVGSWLQEYSQRTHFLDRSQLDLGRARAEAESDRKSRFVAIASHDLRQPLNVINLLLANLGAPLAQGERQRVQEQLGSSVDHLNRLLESLLDMSRLEEGLVHALPESINVSDLLKRVSGEAGLEDEGARLELAMVGPGLWALADPILLRRILRNLILNAQQHADCSRIRLGAHEDGDRVIIEVADDGRGIAFTEQAVLFDPYTKGSGSVSPERGLGLGLAIVAQLTQLMNGSYELDSSPGAGACFRLTFPRAEPCRETDRQSGTTPPDMLGGAQVWIIEPHRTSRQWLARLLERWGYRVHLINRPYGPSDYPAVRPDLVITALNLDSAHEDGHGVLAAIREHIADMPGLILTADSSQRAGFDATSRTWLLHKPVTAPRLRTVVTRLLSTGVDSPSLVS